MLIFRYIEDNFIICYYIYRVKWWTWIADIEMENFEQHIPHLEEYKTWQALKSGEVIPAKRKSAGDAEVSYIPSKKKKISGPVQTKNAVQALNEYKTGGWTRCRVEVTRVICRTAVFSPQPERPKSRTSLCDGSDSQWDSVHRDRGVSCYTSLCSGYSWELLLFNPVNTAYWVDLPENLWLVLERWKNSSWSLTLSEIIFIIIWDINQCGNLFWKTSC